MPSEEMPDCSRKRSRSPRKTFDGVGIQPITELCNALERNIKIALEQVNRKAEDVVVVLDLDETCFTASTENALATSAWFEDLMTRWVPILQSEAGMKHAEVLLECLAVVDCFYSMVPAKLTEDALPELLRRCKEQGIATIGLTARRPDLASVTWQQLGDACPLLFDALTPPLEDKAVKELETLLKANGHAAPDNPDSWEGIRQDRGVWFTANANKGAVLRHTLRQGMHVVFADDSERHLHNVKAALEGHAVSVSLLHYTAARDDARARLDAASCDATLARHCAVLFEQKHGAFMELVQKKQTFLKTFISRQLKQLEGETQPVEASLRTLAASL